MTQFFIERKRFVAATEDNESSSNENSTRIVPENTVEPVARRRNQPIAPSSESFPEESHDSQDESLDEQAGQNSNSYREKMENLNGCWDRAVLQIGAQYLKYISVANKTCCLESCRLNAAAVCKTYPNGCAYCEDHAKEHIVTCLCVQITLSLERTSRIIM